MLNRFEALQKSNSSSSNHAAVKQYSSVDSVVIKQYAEGTLSSSTTACNNTKVARGTKPKLGNRVAHKPSQVRVINRFFFMLILILLFL